MAMVMLMVIVIKIVIVIMLLVIVILTIVLLFVRVIEIVIVLVIVMIISIIVIERMIGIVLVMIGIGTEIGVGNCLRGLTMSPSVASRGPIWEPGGPGHIKNSVSYKFCARPDDATFSVPPRRPVLGLFQERFYSPDGSLAQEGSQNHSPRDSKIVLSCRRGAIYSKINGFAKRCFREAERKRNGERRERHQSSKGDPPK